VTVFGVLFILFLFSILQFDNVFDILHSVLGEKYGVEVPKYPGCEQCVILS
jgi:hypothetical protein